MMVSLQLNSLKGDLFLAELSTGDLFAAKLSTWWYPQKKTVRSSNKICVHLKNGQPIEKCHYRFHLTTTPEVAK